MKQSAPNNPNAPTRALFTLLLSATLVAFVCWCATLVWSVNRHRTGVEERVGWLIQTQQAQRVADDAYHAGEASALTAANLTLTEIAQEIATEPTASESLVAAAATARDSSFLVRDGIDTQGHAEAWITYVHASGDLVGALRSETADISERLAHAWKTLSLLVVFVCLIALFNIVLMVRDQRRVFALAEANDTLRQRERVNVAIQTELEQSHERYRLIAEGITDGIWDWDIERDAIYFSERWLSLWGVAALHQRKMPSSTWLARVHPDDVESLKSLIDDCITTGADSIEHEHRILHADGMYRVALMRANTALRNGKVARLVGSHTDATSQRAFAGMQREFVSVMSHELRTPLTSMMGCIGLLAGVSASEFEPGARRLLETAQASGHKLAKVIDAIVDLDRLEAGSMQLDLRSADLVSIANDVVEQAIPDALTKGLTLDVKSTSNTAKTIVDRDRIQQALSHVVGNAIKFATPATNIDISISERTSFWTLRVTNTGPPIPEAFEAHVFSPFRQADSTDRRSFGGSGVGLAVVREIVELHGGNVTFKSKDGRTSFVIRVPQADLHAHARPDTLH